MSPSTQVALIALILFFAVAVSILWPRLTDLKRSNMKLLPTAIVPATIKVFRSAPSGG